MRLFLGRHQNRSTLVDPTGACQERKLKENGIVEQHELTHRDHRLCLHQEIGIQCLPM
jgi:hypothetical protein